MMIGAKDLSFAFTIYWKEIDELVQHTRAASFELIRKRLTLALERSNDPGVAALVFRQLIEAAIWSCFFNHGIGSAFTILGSSIKRAPIGYAFSKDLGYFVRGAYAESPERVRTFWAAVGDPDAGTNPQFDAHWVDESAPSFKKQGAIVQFMAEGRTGATKSRLVGAVNTLRPAYKALCGFAHITPLSLADAYLSEGHDRPDLPGFAHLMLRAFAACATLFDELVLAPDRNEYSFLTLLREQTPEAHGQPVSTAQMIHLPLPFLNDLRDGNRRVVVDTSEGPVTLYDPRQP